MCADKYYTNSKIAEKCCDILRNAININYKKDIVIEPSAGQGAFIRPIKRLCKNNLFLDICPKHFLIRKSDYLKFVFKDVSKYRKIHIVGNPPFGFKGSLAFKFIKKSAEFCNTIAFILPKSFGKISMQKSVPLNFHLIKCYELPTHSFHHNNKNYDVPSIFQIWIKKPYLRYKPVKLLPHRFVFTDNVQKADFAIRRVGVNAGHIFTKNLQTKNKNTHYFAILDRKSDKKKLKNIISSTKQFSTGPFSISKREFIKILNKMLL